MTTNSPLLITPGEPAGIGPDLVIQLCQERDLSDCIVVADPHLLGERAKLLNLPLKIQCIERTCGPVEHSTKTTQKQTLKVLPVSLKSPCIPGQLNPVNAAYVIETLMFAAKGCLSHRYNGLVTGPVHKAVINEAGIPFKGHTQFLADLADIPNVVMTFIADNLRVALLTAHIPLAQVSAAITQPLLEQTLRVLQQSMQKALGISNPRILVCGLNPHAGENGYLGREEIETITPVLQKLNLEGFHLTGPLPADTIFTPKHLENADMVLAMYHDQGLSVVKYAAFGQAVNLTLGLPFIRTSVDHGTALNIAGTGKADIGSFKAAVELAEKLAR